MLYKDQIERFTPLTEQEENDKKIIIEYIDKFNHNVLLRENEIAHITSSGFIMNPTMDKVLMVHHNIYNTWAWTGGHADGDSDLLYVALKEAKEETGICNIKPLSEEIVSIDILPVYGHVKKGNYVSAHLHLSIAYVLISDEDEELTIKEDENSGVKWIAIDKISDFSNEPYLIEIYKKIILRAKNI
ncbi:NUDIX domain-containing protein [Romboutsia weinsteinii]|uniref:NUDIX domain-containing protein n=1 Tax=Romboutsia weinsteinii TaxID=2020949 RepID=A0A371J035_9FIRM|nr:NUDIX hydrolase [Romboutsia weinsteinii]RDY26073.1 NUDIX domain-containing protein [Romboutsia weinsteinii]